MTEPFKPHIWQVRNKRFVGDEKYDITMGCQHARGTSACGGCYARLYTALKMIEAVPEGAANVVADVFAAMSAEGAAKSLGAKEPRRKREPVVHWLIPTGNSPRCNFNGYGYNGSKDRTKVTCKRCLAIPYEACANCAHEKSEHVPQWCLGADDGQMGIACECLGFQE